jgi:hypothetical protein
VPADINLSDEQSGGLAELEGLSARIKEMNINQESTIMDLRDKLLNSLSRQTQITIEAQNLLRELVDEVRTTRSQLSVLESLRYANMGARESEVKLAHQQTFEWMLQSELGGGLPETGFDDWLRDSGGVYWITGKPGCGKSTLMKFLCHHPIVKQSLTHWAGGQRLLFSTYFFWSSGEEFQKTQEGLLRTLLSQIFTECPQLMPQACGDRWGQSYHWMKDELLDVFWKLSQESSFDSKFCFFIDGLDEFEGDHDDLARLFGRLGSVTNIKVCLSSREWPVFDYHFGATGDEEKPFKCRKLRLHTYTENDMMRLVRGKLCEDDRYQRFLRNLPRNESIKQQDFFNEIILRAQGVFLWVAFVCRELLKGIMNQDTLQVLMSRLDALPVDLEICYMRVINRIDRVYQSLSARVLQVLCVTTEDLKMSAFEYLEDDDFGNRGTSLRGRKSNMSVVAQIKASIGDLVQVDSVSGHVSFIHATVKEFISTSQAQSILRSRGGQNFDPHKYLCRWNLYELLRNAKDSSSQKKLDRLTYHARMYEEHTGKTDEYALDEVATSLANSAVLQKPKSHDLLSNSLKPNEPRIMWMPEWSDEHSFLRFAVHRGLCVYVALKLDQQPNLIYGCGSHLPLLDYATWAGFYDGEIAPARPAAVERMVRLLLDRGASPNEFYKGRTPFLALLTWLAEYTEPAYRISDTASHIRKNTIHPRLDDSVRILELFVYHKAYVFDQWWIEADKIVHPVLLDIFHYQKVRILGHPSIIRKLRGASDRQVRGLEALISRKGAHSLASRALRQVRSIVWACKTIVGLPLYVLWADGAKLVGLAFAAVAVCCAGLSIYLVYRDKVPRPSRIKSIQVQQNQMRLVTLFTVECARLVSETAFFYVAQLTDLKNGLKMLGFRSCCAIMVLVLRFCFPLVLSAEGFAMNFVFIFCGWIGFAVIVAINLEREKDNVAQKT